MRATGDARLVHEESQPLPGWAWIALIACALPGLGIAVAMIAGQIPSARWDLAIVLVVDAILLLMLTFFMAGVRVRVYDDEIVARLGSWPWPFRVALPDLLWCRATTYSPLRDFGGWGMRFGKGIRALNGRGNRGVVLAVADGRRMLLGSDDPERLTDALGALGVTVRPTAETLDEALAD